MQHPVQDRQERGYGCEAVPLAGQEREAVKKCAIPYTEMNEEPTPQNVLVDTSLLNDPQRLRERADALEANSNGKPVDKWCDGEWIPLQEITAFFYDRRYRARP